MMDRFSRPGSLALAMGMFVFFSYLPACDSSSPTSTHGDAATDTDTDTDSDTDTDTDTDIDTDCDSGVDAGTDSGSTDASCDEDPPTISAVCERVIECGASWSSVDECVSAWICLLQPLFRSCMCDCIELDCSVFQPCFDVCYEYCYEHE